MQSAELNFTSTGTIGDGSSLGLTPASGFGSGPVASTGASTDLNGDGNLDLGSTNNASPAGWAIFCQSPGVYATGTGTAVAAATAPTSCWAWSPTRTANATNGQTSQITLDSRAGTLSPVFVYEADGVKKFDSFFGSRAGDLAIGTPVTITYTPPETQDVGMSVGAAFVSRSVATSEAGPTAPVTTKISAATPSVPALASAASAETVLVTPIVVPLAASAANASPLPPSTADTGISPAAAAPTSVVVAPWLLSILRRAMIPWPATSV